MRQLTREHDIFGADTRVYIGHPLRGKGPYSDGQIQANILEISTICRMVYALYPGKTIISPVHMCSWLNAQATCDSEYALTICKSLLDWYTNAVWMFGDWRASEGCRMEVDYARSLDVPVRFLARREDGIYVVDKDYCCAVNEADEYGDDV